ncbi:MAG: hypothetical protein ACM3US_09215 [Sphingomonadaceae bacterium]
MIDHRLDVSKNRAGRGLPEVGAPVMPRLTQRSLDAEMVRWRAG